MAADWKEFVGDDMQVNNSSCFATVTTAARTRPDLSSISLCSPEFGRGFGDRASAVFPLDSVSIESVENQWPM